MINYNLKHVLGLRVTSSCMFRAIQIAMRLHNKTRKSVKQFDVFAWFDRMLAH